MRIAPRSPGVLVSAVMLLVGFSACQRSHEDFADSAFLLDIVFPDPLDQNAEPESDPPADASLIQQVKFRFSGRPHPSRVDERTLPILDELGKVVPGTYEVRAHFVVFTPSLPLRPIEELEDGSWDNGGGGLWPGSAYRVRLDPRRSAFLRGFSKELLARFSHPEDPEVLLATFRTTMEPSRFLSGLEHRAPHLVRSEPHDGAANVSPNLYTDPDHVFAPRQSFRLVFDAPLNPGLANVGDTTFGLIDLDEGNGSPLSGLSLGVNVSIQINEPRRAIVEIEPSGILPFGHLLALEYPESLQGISEGDASGTERIVATVLSIAPAGEDTIVDVLREDFLDRRRQDTSFSDVEAYEASVAPADWDRDESDLLQASLFSQDGGDLGRFVPQVYDEPRTICINTDIQRLPLYDGSTPDAPLIDVEGGVFEFTEIVIPDGITIKARGGHPLVLRATGTVRIAGIIDAGGADGLYESQYDGGEQSLPGGVGGPGGGRGGEGHPLVFFPPDQLDPLNLVSPKAGGRGWGPEHDEPIGGHGGESGILDNEPIGVDFEIDCIEFYRDKGNGGKVPGGGGGSLLDTGYRGKRGTGNVRADGEGGFVVDFEKDVLKGGPGGDLPFANEDALDDFIGVRGELKNIFGGQGGGAGGSRIESYYCGPWCLLDDEPGNDGLCLGGEFPWGDAEDQIWPMSRGDARGGAGGGGGGAVHVQALGKIVVRPKGRILARGGEGGGGELYCGQFGGNGGGGSGGTVILESATSVEVLGGAQIDVAGGEGEPAAPDDSSSSCYETDRRNQGSGGDGGHGIIQLQVPFGRTALVEDPPANLVPLAAWVDPENARNPAAFSSRSAAVSRWFDLGAAVSRPPEGTNPVFQFRGLDTLGFVVTDDEGFVLEPRIVDIHCAYLGRLHQDSDQYEPGEEPKDHFIPPSASIRVEFQAADAVTEGSKEVDPSSLTPWSPDLSPANGHQFLRYRITFDAAAGEEPLNSASRLPAVRRIQIHAEF